MQIGYVIIVVLTYLGVLAAVALIAEKKARKKTNVLSKPWMYSFSLAVYCTAWTFYGSVGRVAEGGLDFLTIYSGPVLGTLLFGIVLKKTIRITKILKINSLADFLSTRYGKNLSIGVFVAIFSLMGIIPYISLQLKSISESIVIVSGTQSIVLYGLRLDFGFIVAFVVTLFTVVFGLRKIDLTEKHEGIVVAIVVEAVVKILALVIIAVFAIFWLSKTTFVPSSIPLKKESDFHWLMMITLSLFAFFLLPRQWQMGVTENVNENQIKSAAWQFPTYLLIINACVLPIAFAGKHLLPISYNPDYFVLSLPIYQNFQVLTIIAFLGGFAAASGMIVVSTISLATMLTNSVLLPLGFRYKLIKTPTRFLSYIGVIRKLSVITIACLAYIYYQFFTLKISLISIGLVSFVAVAQFAPATIGALFWKKGNARGAFWGMIVGATVWFYLLLLPDILIYFFKMTDSNFMFPLIIPDSLTPISHAFFWSILLNTVVYIGFSIFKQQNATEINQAELFVNIFNYSDRLEECILWRGSASIKDLKNLLKSFLGSEKYEQALRVYEKRYKQDIMQGDSDHKFVTYTENVLSSVVGNSTARILVSAVSKEDFIGFDEVVSILKESKQILELNTELKQTSNQLLKTTDDLIQANERLKKHDELKNEFLYTLTHEIRTPITSIRSFTEILRDDKNISEEDRTRFIDIMCKELARLSVLISQILDLEKYESGKYHLQFVETDINELLKETVSSLKNLFDEKKITVELQLQPSILPIRIDTDKIKQVFINLISNAIKYSPTEKKMVISTYFLDNDVRINFKDHGCGIALDEMDSIFNKFYQIKKNVNGNGLGLAISKEIINLHKGKIWIDREYTSGAKFCVSLPKYISP